MQPDTKNNFANGDQRDTPTAAGEWAMGQGELPAVLKSASKSHCVYPATNAGGKPPGTNTPVRTDNLN